MLICFEENESLSGELECAEHKTARDVKVPTQLIL